MYIGLLYYITKNHKEDTKNDKSYLQGYHKEKPPKRNWTAFFIPR